jgi:predicted ATP-grasp superfamily ATP-dependent carboligase
MSVIVTNAKSRVAYNVTRSLGGKGIEVYTSDFVRSSMSFYSRYSRGHFLYPSPFTHQEQFIRSILENVDRLKAEVVVPVHEETFLMAKFKDELSRHVKVVLPDYKQILAVHNKDKWINIAQELNVPSPKTYLIEALRRPGGLTNVLFPVLIKPKQGGGGWAITQVNSRHELSELLERELYIGLPWERFYAQEKIDGEVHCVAMLFCAGRYRAKVAYKQIREYPVSGGQATLRISLRNEDAEEGLRKILEHLKWHGICQADFVVDGKTGVSYLIDMNPRFWGSLAQGIASGVDFPYLLYKIAVEGDIEPVREFKTGVVTQWFGGDIRALLSLLKSSNARMDLVKKFVVSSSAAVFYDDICLKDPLPFFAWMADILGRSLKQGSLKPGVHESLEGVWE